MGKLRRGQEFKLDLMDVELSTTSVQQTGRTHTSFHSNKQVTIICCYCSIPFVPSITGTNVCPKCLTSKVDITIGITKQAILNYCRQCKRYLRPPWIDCALESRELLALCLRKIRGLNRVKLLDANFLYTEPHSKRIKMRLKVSKDVMANTNIEQTFDVEFIVHSQQCEDCKKEFTPHTWGACVQVRQKTLHKKTFFFLEQIILKHNAHEKAINIKEEPDGLDFFFKTRSHANRLIDFLQGFIPVKMKMSKQLVSHDTHTNVYAYKYVYFLELPKICKDDLVVITDPRLSKDLGGASNILLCYKLSNVVHLLDPIRMQRVEMNAETYFLQEEKLTFVPLRNNATEFMVQKTEKYDASKANTSFSFYGLKFQAADVEVSRTSDWQPFFVKTHLGDIIKSGDTVLGFDLSTLSLPEELDERFVTRLAQDVFLVRKVYQGRRTKKRVWKLRRMNIEEDENVKKKVANAKEREYEEFLEDVEKDPELRQQLNLYRDEDVLRELEQEMEGLDVNREKTEEEKKELRRKVKVIGANPKAVEVKPVETAGHAKEEEVRLEDLLCDLKIADVDLKENDDLVDAFMKNLTISEEKAPPK
eukprot:TRINITY_DN4472_c0_g2_i1.p1 TRINITY_DN4472_c0_g2~~TRINITY_DN4472_c0_g2_i1.p1  ORF type:complete len:590 (+),score=125.96 TRINITY_DN4472_c0_g2_i1:34-1803(+)